MLGRGRSPNLAWVLLAGVLVVAAGGAIIGGGARGLFGPAATPTAAPVALRACTPYDADAVITAWDGAAGHRIATVELHQIGTTPCAIDPLPQPWLADGSGTPLITGKAGAGTPISFAPGDVLHTLVQVGNYCGPDPVAPGHRGVHPGRGRVRRHRPDAADLSGVPPCNGEAGPRDDIQMQPWSR